MMRHATIFKHNRKAPGSEGLKLHRPGRGAHLVGSRGADSWEVKGILKAPT